MRWLAAGLTAWVYAEAASRVPAHAGVSTFGDPPVQAAAWVAAGLGLAIAMAATADRLVLARRLVYALLATILLGPAGVPADSGLRLVLLAVTLLAAAPYLRRSAAAWGAAAALALAVPGLLGGVYPHGAVLWLAFALPPMALAWLLPSLFPGDDAGRPALCLLVVMALFALLSLWDYVELSDGLDLPLAAVLATRLRVMGLHPNLAVPSLVVSLVLGAALAARAAGRARLARLALLAPVIAALVAVRSRTGFATALFGLGLLWITARPGRFGRVATVLAVTFVAGMLLVPATGLSDANIGRRSSSMVDKSVSFRSAMWALGRRTVAAAPFHGNGPGTMYLQAGHALPGPLDGYPKDDHPHSLVLAVTESLGWPGLAGLLLVFALGLRRPRDGDRLGAAARAGVLALFAANAMDLGGAQDSLYPELVFLLLGLADARRATPVAAPAPAPAAGPVAGPARRRALVLPAVACAALGLALWAGGSAERQARERLDGAERDGVPAAERDAALTAARTSLARAARWTPLSPGVPLLSARLAALAGEPAAEVAALERARGRLPRSAVLAHRLAVARSRDSPADPRVEALLDDALRWDPYGPDAWRRHLDRARVALLRGLEDEARDALVTALMLNPQAATGAPTRGREADLVIYPVGTGHPGVALGDVLADLAAQRDAAHDEASTTLRLAARLVEIPLSLGAWDLADTYRQELLGDEPLYRAIQRARIQIARGDWEGALPALRDAAALGYFWTQVDYVDALSRLADVPSDAFQAQYDEAIARMRSQSVDCVFDLPRVSTLIEARRRWHERRGDAPGAVRAADALAYARR
jgi:hypothetical protein